MAKKDQYDLSHLGGVEEHDLSSLGGIPIDDEQEQVKQSLINRLGNSGLVSGINRIGGDIGAGGLEGVGKLLHMITSGGSNNPLSVNAPSAEQLVKQSGLGGSELGDKLIQGMTSYAPAGAIGKALEGVGAIPNILKNIPKIGKVLTGAESQLVPGAIYGSSEDESNPLAALKGAAIGAGGGVAGDLLGKGINALKPSSFLRGNLTPEELAKNLEVTKGTETNLGDVIKNPLMKQTFENILSKIPLSGVTQSQQRTGAQLVTKGQSLLSSLAKEDEGKDIPSLLTEQLDKGFKEAKANKNSIYNKADSLAKDSGLNINLDKFAKSTKDYKDAIDSTDILKYEPETRNLYEKLKNYSQGLSDSNPSLKEAGILKGSLSRLAAKYGASPDQSSRNMAGVFSKLSGDLRSDISDSIAKHGNKELSDTYGQANKEYGEKFAPYLDKNIYKFLNDKSDSDTLIKNFVKVGKNSDRANLVNKLVSVLPQDKKDLVGYHILSVANKGSNFNPTAMKTAYENLGERQKKVIFQNPETREKIEDYNNLVGQNKDSLYTMFNPKTGAQLGNFIPVAAIMSGHIPAIAAAAGTMAAGRIGKNLLTSEKVRTNLINKMLENSTKKQSSNPSSLINSILQSQLTGGRQNGS